MFSLYCNLVFVYICACALSSLYSHRNATNVLPLIPPLWPPTVALHRSALQPKKAAFLHIRADFHRDRTHLSAGLIPQCQAVSTAPPLFLNTLVRLLVDQTDWNQRHVQLSVMRITGFVFHTARRCWVWFLFCTPSMNTCYSRLSVDIVLICCPRHAL